MAYNWFTEAMILYAIGMTVFFLRVYARTRLVGFRGWKGDDYFMVLAICFWTITNGCFKTMYDGSELVGWFSYISFIWSLKASMACFYARLTSGLGDRKLLRICSAIVAISWIACLLENILRCLPVDKIWDIVKYPGERPKNCRTSELNFWFVGFLNLITDILLLCIPIPLLWKLQLPWRRKLAIGILLCSGMFIIIATILRNTYGIIQVATKQASIQGIVIAWSVRESLVSIIVVNAPSIKSLFTSKSWSKQSSSGSGQSRNKGDSRIPPTYGSAGGAKRMRDPMLNGNWTVLGDMSNNSKEKDLEIKVHTTTTVKIIDEEAGISSNRGDTSDSASREGGSIRRPSQVALFPPRIGYAQTSDHQRTVDISGSPGRFDMA